MKKSYFLLPLVIFAWSTVDLRAENLKTVEDFRPAAAKANAVLTLPDWEHTPEAVDTMTKNAIDTANRSAPSTQAKLLSRARSSRSMISLGPRGMPRVAQ